MGEMAVGDVLALYAGTFLCLVAFVVRIVRADARAGHPVDPGWRGWLLVATAVLAALGGTVLALSRLFSG
jgi:hypothetical protein